MKGLDAVADSPGLESKEIGACRNCKRGDLVTFEKGISVELLSVIDPVPTSLH
jgi:hypothetical protein